MLFVNFKIIIGEQLKHFNFWKNANQRKLFYKDYVTFGLANNVT